MKSKKMWFFLVVGGLLLFAAIAYLLIAERLNFGIPCVFHSITGLYCPGCGITRALTAILHGQIITALRYNAAVVILAPVLGGAVGIGIYEQITHKCARLSRGINALFIASSIMLVLFGILRNLSLFSFLAPPL